MGGSRRKPNLCSGGHPLRVMREGLLTPAWGAVAGIQSGSRRKRSRPASLQGATPKSGDAFPAWLDAGTSTGVSPCGVSPTLPRHVKPWVSATAGIVPVHTR
jgi:hypothetical protein